MRIRKKALRDPKYDLKAILLDGRRDEQSAFQPHDIENKESGRNEVSKISQTEKICRNCGGSYPLTGNCPAKNRQCKKCGKFNHFAKVHRGKSQHKENHEANQEKRRKNRPAKRIYNHLQATVNRAFKTTF